MFLQKTLKEINTRLDYCDTNTESLKEAAAIRLSSLDKRVLDMEKDFAEQIVELQDNINGLMNLINNQSELNDKLNEVNAILIERVEVLEAKLNIAIEHASQKTAIRKQIKDVDTKTN